MQEAQSPEIRISDTERETAINALGEHMSSGRLDITEYGDRSAKATAARTRGELVELFADLPEPKPRFDAPAPVKVDTPAPAPVEPKKWSGVPKEITGPIIGVSWVAAMFVGPSIHAPWMFGAAIAVSIVMGSLTRKGSHDERHEQRKELKEELRARRRELRRGE